MTTNIDGEPERRDVGPRSKPELPRQDLLRLMQRLGYSNAQIAEVRAQLPEMIDSIVDRPVLERYGLTRTMLMERFGSSP